MVALLWLAVLCWDVDDIHGLLLQLDRNHDVRAIFFIISLFCRHVTSSECWRHWFKLQVSLSANPAIADKHNAGDRNTKLVNLYNEVMICDLMKWSIFLWNLQLKIVLGAHGHVLTNLYDFIGCPNSISIKILRFWLQYELGWSVPASWSYGQANWNDRANF